MTTTQTIVTVAIVCVMIGYRIYRQTREQRWAIGSLWVLPGILLALTALIVATDTVQQPLSLAAGVVGLVAGLALGLYQGNHTVLRFDKPGRAVFVRVKPIGSLIFVAVLVLRFALRYPMMSSAMQTQAHGGALPPLSLPEALLGSGLLALAAGSVAGLRWYIQRAYNVAPG